MKPLNWILLAEDDAATAELTMLALAPAELACDVIIARDGLEVLDCIHRRGAFEARIRNLPRFVLLDLKMPKVDGLEVLRQLKSDRQLKRIPIVMFTSSREVTDMDRSYELGVNAYVVKPSDFKEFDRTLKRLGAFWMAVNELPPEGPRILDLAQRVEVNHAE